MTEALEIATLALLGLAAALAVGRLLRPSSLPDRVLGADTLIFVISATVAAGTGLTGIPFFLGVLIVVTLLGFVGTITVARYVEKRGAAP